jgi:anti-sigma regulatory factor (Ser/Thr protein kinase)
MFLASVGEAMTNALKHANGGEVFCGSSREELWVGIADTGPGISTLTIPSAMLRRGYSTKASLGMGFSIMLDASDRVLLSTGPEGTTVILFKRLGEEIPRISLADLADTWDTIRPM